MNNVKVLKKVKMYCSICDEEHELDLCERLTDNIIKGDKVEYIEHFYRCNKFRKDNCFLENEMIDEALINGYDAYRKKHDLLTSKDIKNIRKKYGLTQAELAFLMGLGEITITRYETKQIQEVSNDVMLKEINNNAILALNLLEKNKNKFSEKRYLEISKNIKNIIDNETISFLKEQEVFAKYLNFNEKNLENGNILLNIEKLKNVLAYIAYKSEVIKKVVLMKTLWYIDCLNYKLYGKAITGLVYIHAQFGALPIAHEEIIELSSLNCEKKLREEDRYEYNISKKESYKIVGLTKKEKDIIDKVLEKFKGYDTNAMVNYMHKEKAYINTKDDDIISFEYAKDLREF